MRILNRTLYLFSVLALMVFLFVSPLASTHAAENLELQIPVPDHKNPAKFTSTIDLCEEDAAGSLVCNGIPNYFLGLYIWIITAAAIVAVVILMAGGMQWMTSRGSSAGINAAKKKISNALIGIVLLLGSYSLLYLINPALTVFKPLNLGKPIQKCTEEITENCIEDLNITLVDADVYDPTINTSGTTFSGTGQNNVPFFSQTDSRWPHLAKSGCGITSFAMVANFYGKNTDPAKVYTANGNSTSGNYPGLASRYGLKYEWIPHTNFSKIDTLIKSGKPIMMYTKNSKFTSRYHFVVITGYDSTTQQYRINDPNGGRVTSATLNDLTTPIVASGKGWSYPTFGYVYP